MVVWMNFLVTGGAGFIGSHVCERLLMNGHAVWTLDSLAPFYNPAIKRATLKHLADLGKTFHFIEGDLRDENAVQVAVESAPFDQIIHLAACAGVRPSLQEPAFFQQVNVVGTVNLLEAARKQGVVQEIPEHAYHRAYPSLCTSPCATTRSLSSVSEPVYLAAT